MCRALIFQRKVRDKHPQVPTRAHLHCLYASKHEHKQVAANTLPSFRSDYKPRERRTSAVCMPPKSISAAYSASSESTALVSWSSAWQARCSRAGSIAATACCPSFVWAKAATCSAGDLGAAFSCFQGVCRAVVAARAIRERYGGC